MLRAYLDDARGEEFALRWSSHRVNERNAAGMPATPLAPVDGLSLRQPDHDLLMNLRMIVLHDLPVSGDR